MLDMLSTHGLYKNRRDWLRMAGAAGIGGLLNATEPKVSTPSFNTLSEAEEIALGQKFAARYEKDVQILHNPAIDQYLSGIVKKLGDASQKPSWPYRVKVVNTSEVNACAIPGGALYLQRGLLEFVEDENEMVGALAHEVGHIVARHTTNQLMAAFLARNLYERVKKNLMLQNTIVEQIIEALGGPLVMLAQLKYSRENESEADLLGFYEMLRAGWHPNGLLKFFTRLQTLEGQRNAIDVMTSDHPATPERARVLRQELAVVRVPPQAREQTIQFKALKAALSVMPAAPKPVKKG
jgi:beta-barrel assembly-enhancing protease